MKRIKVVHLIHGLNMGGAETLVKNYALLMNKDRFDVTVVSLERLNSPYEKTLEDAGIPVIYLRERMMLGSKKGLFSKVLNHYGLYFEVSKVLHSLEPDILHVHLELNEYVLFSHLPQRTCIFYTNHHTTSRWMEDRKDIKAMRKIIRKYPTRIIALTDEMKDEINALFNVDNTAVLNNGIDLSLYDRPIDRSQKRSALGIPEGAFIIVHVGRFNAIKNHRFLISVFDEIKKKKPEAFLLMVGRGETEDEISEELKRKHLENSALILRDREDVPELLKMSDAAVFPSLSEGLGIAVIEMQAAGLHCVVSEGVPERAKVSNRIQFLKLEQGSKIWADELLSSINEDESIAYDNIEAWDIRQNVKELEKMYQEAVNNVR